MKKRIVVNCLDDGKEYVFLANTPYEALQNMRYTINLYSKCDAEINKTESGLHLWFEHDGKTYAVANKR